MIQRLLPHPLLTPILALVWMLLANEFSAGHAVLGLLLGWAIPIFTLRFWPEQTRIRRPLTLLRFIAVVLYDILIANLAVAQLIVSRPRRLQPAFLEVPLDVRSDLAISLLANTISLTPGTVSAELSPERDRLLVHALHATDTEALVATIKTRYEAPLKEIFEE
ncbi:multisubunit Na+/H+ antiporter, MnhE subunit [Thiohalobacter thiocyanaticus]|uniref:Multisubunit Na+/H+ antiporter, MnhE subunit n=1 Tax=Thiohalobacter thiocyanaticus TaxID=585455 RepID=A0A1Z4VSU3_9GAMM|nr:Na+/H+ antiporter subunit E [Thiohalobacter thiocyanaticus]BAZ94472.1 multisubunit Na+/H+ antiporter, MnhE subunit [Thiohalobacter thiocyanaticus]